MAQTFVNIKFYLALKMIMTMITFTLKITIILFCNEVFNSECENSITSKKWLQVCFTSIRKKYMWNLTTENNFQTHQWKQSKLLLIQIVSLWHMYFRVKIIHLNRRLGSWLASNMIAIFLMYSKYVLCFTECLHFQIANTNLCLKYLSF